MAGRKCKKIYLTKEKKEFAEKNFHLVIWYINKVLYKQKKIPMRFKNEFISDVCLRFCQAVNNYDPKKGKFSTIAMYYFNSAFYRLNDKRKLPRRNYILTPIGCLDYDDADADPQYLYIMNSLCVDDENKFDFEKEIFNIHDICKKSKLDKREKDIIIYYYKKEYKISLIAKKYNLTYERVRQIKKEAISKIRDYVNEKQLKFDEIMIA